MAAWEQMTGESDESFARFLMYRNLGPSRSMRKAYLRYLQEADGFTGGAKRLHIPGQWQRDSSNFFWVERAAAWDVRNLQAYGGRLAVLHTQAMVELAKKNCRYARRLKPGDDGYADMLRSVQVVAAFLTPEFVKGIADEGREPRRVAAAAADDGVT